MLIPAYRPVHTTHAAGLRPQYTTVTPMALLYYISGHGFGHARRSAEIVRLFAARHPELPVHIRTLAEPSIFAGLGPNVHFEPVAIDRGAIEHDALTINWPATLDLVRQQLRDKDAFLATETRFIRDRQIRLIIADVPFMAGYVAHATGVPCYAQCNFLWDWIYAPYTDDVELLAAVGQGYAYMAGQLRLQYPHPTPHFTRTWDIPFIATLPTLSAAETLRRLRISPEDPRPRILIGMRGGTAPAILQQLTNLQSRYLFLCVTGHVFAPEGLATLDSHGVQNASPSFWDIMQTCDGVLSKPGHGIITDCAALGVGLIYPQRNGFPEDDMILAGSRHLFRQQSISLHDYHAGHWENALQALLAQPKPQPAANTNGREVIADFIARQLRCT